MNDPQRPTGNRPDAPAQGQTPDESRDRAASRDTSSSTGTAADPDVQGEGNYTAARRHRESAENFVDSGRVEQAARDAAPDSAQQEQELRDAERAGKAPARR